MKNILITGATGGIGKAIATTLLNLYEDIKIYGMGRRASDLSHSNYYSLTCDLQDPKETEKKTKELVYSVQQLDAIILAAGFGKFAEIEQFSLNDMQAMMNVNFLSQAIVIKIVLPLLKKTSNSKIIGIASEAALNGAKKGSIYCASKFALRGFLQSLRAECNQSNTAITIVNPGLVKSDFFNTLNFEPGMASENSINIEQVAKTVAFILQMENNCVLEEINLQPMKKVIRKKKDFISPTVPS